MNSFRGVSKNKIKKLFIFIVLVMFSNITSVFAYIYRAGSKNTDQDIQTNYENHSFTIDNRMNELSFLPFEIKVSNGIGVAAGDDGAKRNLQGIWITGLYGTSKQCVDKGVAGYNGITTGGVIGSDITLSDRNIIGIAYSNMRSSFKYKQTRAGDKAINNSHILSLYFTYNFNNNLSLKSMLAAGINKTTTKKLIIDKIATNEAKNKSYIAEAFINYKMLSLENLYFIPNIGFRYAYYKNGAYSDRGVGVRNLLVAAKSNDKFTIITGGNIMMPKQASETLTITPSVHASIESYLQSKKLIVKAKQKFGYNIGGGILTKSNNLEVLVKYNCNFRKKYQNNKGEIKFKILF